MDLLNKFENMVASSLTVKDRPDTYEETLLYLSDNYSRINSKDLVDKIISDATTSLKSYVTLDGIDLTVEVQNSAAVENDQKLRLMIASRLLLLKNILKYTGKTQLAIKVADPYVELKVALKLNIAYYSLGAVAREMENITLNEKGGFQLQKREVSGDDFFIEMECQINYLGQEVKDIKVSKQTDSENKMVHTSVEGHS